MSKRIVIDANVTLAQVLPLPYSDQVFKCMQIWNEEMAEIFVPTLWEYEVVSALRKTEARGLLTQEQAFQVIENIMFMELEQIHPSAKLDKMALYWAGTLGHLNAYDAQYLAVAEAIGAEFWTADSRLVNNVRQVGTTWVHWVGETGE